ncbi:M43 family zinc metalloprotease [Streptosporangium sp. NPDC004379]|uniref:zinc metalloprotease n=1 Tax=Streptosporangium sp. NPDC004379 TaxID=3366189 RepID=UPI0036A1C55D
MARRAIAVLVMCVSAAGSAPGAPSRPSAVAGPARCAETARAPVPGMPAVRLPVPGAPAESTPVRESFPGTRARAPFPGVRAEAARVRAPLPGASVESHGSGRVQAEEMLADLRARQARLPRPAGLSWTPVTVPVQAHVITAGSLGAPDDTVRAQIATLNAAYGGRYGGADTGIRFRLDGLTRTDDPVLFRDPLGRLATLERMRRGGPETLNLYIAQLGRLVLGYSTYPYWYAGDPAGDGVVLDWRTLPGGSLRDFGLGFTGVHEIGHWLGLLHTFENGCLPLGDTVDDTPSEGLPTQGCPVRKDTCAGDGADPVHNFMDYTHDRCMSGFTEGQATRMREMWTAYRRTPPAGPEPEATHRQASPAEPEAGTMRERARAAGPEPGTPYRQAPPARP